MYNEECDNPDETDVYIRKNRNGPIGRVTLSFDATRMRFHDRVRA
jgi:replicative DNA helicase